MKKWIFLLALTRPVLALYMGNPCASQIIEEGFLFCKENDFAVKASCQRDWVFDRNMKAVSKISGRFDTFEYLADQGVLTVNLIDLIELYGSLGAMSISASNQPSGSSAYQKYQTSNQCTWGLGFRGKFCDYKGFSFGISGAYQQSQPHIKRITSNGEPIDPKKGSKIAFYEWQVALGVSYQIDMFIPYVGGKWSNAGATFKHLPPGLRMTTDHFKTKNQKKFGMAIGTTLSPENRFAVTLEARLIDEQSMTLTLDIKF